MVFIYLSLNLMTLTTIPHAKMLNDNFLFLSILFSSLQQGFQRFRIWQNIFISFWQIIICFIRYYSHRFRGISECKFYYFIVLLFAKNNSNRRIFVWLFHHFVQFRKIEIHFTNIFRFKLPLFQLNSY